MELRKEIESLALWYIPAFFVMLMVSAIFTGYFKQLIEYGSVSVGTPIALVQILGQFISNIDNFVVGIWLYLQSKKEGGRTLLWFLFGMVAHFFAAVLYIGLKILDNQQSYNNALKKDAQ